jgi:hypothetical protein
VTEFYNGIPADDVTLTTVADALMVALVGGTQAAAMDLGGRGEGVLRFLIMPLGNTLKH